MSIRVPPRTATWLLKHLGPRYGNESLAGDLCEEYQLDRSRAWYWRQVIMAACLGQASNARTGLLRVLRSRPLSILPKIATSAALRFSIEGAALVGALALTEQLRRGCSAESISAIAGIVTVVGGIGLCLSLGTYLALSMAPPLRRNSSVRRNAPMKRLLGVFTITVLSAGTLTWASGTSHPSQQCRYQGAPAIVSFATSMETRVSAK